MKEIMRLSDIANSRSFGGKGRMLSELMDRSFNVPDGFVVPSGAFDDFLEYNGLIDRIGAELSGISTRDLGVLVRKSENIRDMIFSGSFRQESEDSLFEHFDELGASSVAVRSSAQNEDGRAHAWAGQLESRLNTKRSGLFDDIKFTWASFYGMRAICYAINFGYDIRKPAMAVIVQRMVRSEKSGVIFTINPVTDIEDELVIEAGPGLGEALVGGSIIPDSYTVSKSTETITGKRIRSEEAILNDCEIRELAQCAIRAENMFSMPCDIEWILAENTLHIVQCRPITTYHPRN